MNFIYVINLFIFCQSVIKFHFKRKYNPSNIDNSLKYYEYLTKNDLITEISIGTPNQKIPVSLIIDSDFLYLTIPSSKGLFNSNNSNTFYSNFQEYEISNEIVKKGYSAQDNINLNINNKEKTISNISFLYAIEPKANILNLGGIGLCHKPYYKESNNLIVQLKNKELIDNYAYTIQFINNNEGYLYLGEYPHSYNKTYYDSVNFNSMPVSLTFIWVSNFNEVNFGNEIINEKQFELNYTIAGILGVKSLVKYFDSFFQPKINENKCKEYNDNGYTYYECNSNLKISDFPILSFYHKDSNFTFVLTYEDLFEVINGKLYCKIIFRKGLDKRWCLGQPFIQKYMITFDQNKKIFGFYDKINEIKGFLTWYKITFFFLIIVIIFSIIILVNYIRKKPRKIRANEIEEDIDYTPINS